jgi:oxepin-CoA hydrolase/3-oxo-5,6-dehydrosuberyl-CoA semialdehyde dehydrogenase
VAWCVVRGAWCVQVTNQNDELVASYDILTLVQKRA